jgi:hypothetical protein
VWIFLSSSCGSSFLNNIYDGMSEAKKPTIIGLEQIIPPKIWVVVVRVVLQ